MSGGKPGPKPKPTAVRIFEGDPGRLLAKRQGEVTPPIPDEVPAPPDWLGEVGQAKWLEKAAILHPLGMLTKNDCDHLAMYCEAWDELFAAMKEIEKCGMICMSDKGGEYQHPAVGIKNKAVDRIRKFGCDFGMNPTARVGLNIGGQQKPGGLAAFKKAT